MTHSIVIDKTWPDNKAEISGTVKDNTIIMRISTSSEWT